MDKNENVFSEKEFPDTDIEYMKRALRLAERAAKAGDVPVGAVIVKDGEVVSEGYNTREANQNSLEHAEIIAIDKACRAMQSRRLDGCTLYVTLEPCPMCAGAIVNSNISRVVYGAKDSVAGGMGSIWCIHKNPMSRNNISVSDGCLSDDCRDILQEFFAKRR